MSTPYPFAILYGNAREGHFAQPLLYNESLYYMWQQWVNVFLGLWVAFLPFVPMSPGSLAWMMIVTGAAVAIFGVWGARETTRERKQANMMHRPQH